MENSFDYYFDEAMRRKGVFENNTAKGVKLNNYYNQGFIPLVAHNVREGDYTINIKTGEIMEYHLRTHMHEQVQTTNGFVTLKTRNNSMELYNYQQENQFSVNKLLKQSIKSTEKFIDRMEERLHEQKSNISS